MISLTKLSETASTITLGWSPPTGAGGYVFYANGQVVSVGTANLKDGSPRKSVKFSKTSPGPPYYVTVVVRSGGIFSLGVASYPPAGSGTFPSQTIYPSEATP